MGKIDFDYLSAADRMFEKGDYEAALHYCFLQRNTRRENEVDIMIGDAYASLGLVNEALRFYMRAYADDQSLEEALNGIIFCLKDIDEDAAYYYLNSVLTDDEEFEDLIIEDFDDFGYQPLFVHDKRDKSDVMEEVARLIENGDTDGAQRALEAIGRDDYQYCDSILTRATLAMDKADADKALALADEALGIDPSHVGTHVLKIMAYDALGQKDKAEEWVRRLDALDPRDEDGVTKAALCFCNYDRLDLAEKYILRKLDFDPYDKMMLMCLAAVYVRKDDMSGAFRIANKACSVFACDIELKEIMSRILSGKSVGMPGEVFALKRDWIKDIKEMFISGGDAVLEPENVRKIKWLLQGNDDLYLQSAASAFLTGVPEYEAIMDDVLIDPFAPTLVKKQILLRRVCDEKTESVKFVVSNMFRKLDVTHPAVADNLKYAYYYVFVALCVREFNFETRLNKALARLGRKFEKCADAGKTDLTINALAAVLFKLTDGGSVRNCCDYFDCSRSDYNKVIEMLGVKGRK